MICIHVMYVYCALSLCTDRCVRWRVSIMGQVKNACSSRGCTVLDALAFNAPHPVCAAVYSAWMQCDSQHGMQGMCKQLALQEVFPASNTSCTCQLSAFPASLLLAVVCTPVNVISANGAGVHTFS